MCMCVYVCLYMCVCAYVCMCMCVYACVRESIYDSFQTGVITIDLPFVENVIDHYRKNCLEFHRNGLTDWVFKLFSHHFAIDFIRKITKNM